jgi:hypothetical protein
MTHLVSVFSRGASQIIEAAPVAKLETKILRRQAALMPLKKKLTATFIEVMEKSISDDTTAKAAIINANGMGANNEDDVQQAIYQLEALISGGFMPPIQKVA